MNDKEKDEILNNWKFIFEERTQKLLEEVKRLRLKTQNDIDLKVWLGGPGKDRKDNLYELRSLIGQFLMKSNITVVFSEEYNGCADIVSKELEECAALDATFIMCMSSGSSAESIEFAHDELIKSKLNIYIPDKYMSGFVYKALNAKHRLINEDSLFNLENFKNFDPELPINILTKAIDYRNEKFRRKQMPN